MRGKNLPRCQRVSWRFEGRTASRTNEEAVVDEGCMTKEPCKYGQASLYSTLGPFLQLDPEGKSSSANSADCFL